MKRETRFTSKRPANEIMSKIEEAALPLGFDVKKNNYKVQKTVMFLYFTHDRFWIWYIYTCKFLGPCSF